MSLGIPSGSPDPAENLTAALRAAPELQQSPGAALAVAQTNAPAANAQAVGYSLQQQSLSAATDQFTQTAGHAPRHRSLWDKLSIGAVAHDVANDVVAPVQRDVMNQHIPGGSGPFKTVGGALGATPMGALTLANTPLQHVTHQYRYLRDVWQRHGPIPAIAEAAAMAGVGYAASEATGNTNVGVLAGETAGEALGNLFYKDSWDRTANGSAYRDSTGQLVSPGRDIARGLNTVDRALGLPGTIGTHGAAHGIVAGGLDGLFDVMMDPVQRVGGIYGEAKSAAGAINIPWTGNKLFVGTSAINPGDAEMIYNKASGLGRLDPGAVQFKRAVGFMAGHSSSEIADRFPQVLQTPGLADRLGAATTDQQVLNVFEDRLAFEKAMNEGRFTPLKVLNPTTGATVDAAQTKPAFVQGLPTESSLQAAMKGGITRLENLPGVGQRFRSLEILPDNMRVSVVGDTGAENLRRLALQGMPPRVANDLIDEFLATNDIEERQRIIKAVSEATVLGRAGITDQSELDAGLLSKVRSRIDQVMGGERPVGEYGINTDGSNLSPLTVRDPAGNVKATAGAAIWKGQTSMDRGILGYADVKDLSQQIRGYRSLFGWPGKIDDFAWNHFTDTWRRLALLTGSFAMHITAAEQLLNTARLGFVPMVNGYIAKLADLGYGVSKEDAGPIRALVYHLIGSPKAEEFAALAEDPAFADKVSLATHMAVATGGAGVSPEMSAGYVFPTTGESGVETSRSALDGGHVQLSAKERVGSTYKLYRSDDKNAAIWWGQHLNQIAEDPTGQAAAKAYGAALTNGLGDQEASRRALEAVRGEMAKWTPEERQLYLRSTQTSIDGVDPMDAFARTKVESLKGAVHNPAADAPHQDLVAKIANGDKMTWRDVADIPPGQRPINIPGREIVPNMDGRVDRLAQLGHEKILSPIINFFSRQPTYYAETAKAFELYKPLVESGLLDRGVAMDYAMQDANMKMIRYIHNPQERLQATETFRNVAPFGFAQVQAYKRYGRLLLEDPGAFRRVQLALTGMTELANRAKDPNGIQQAVYPGSGYMTKGMLTAAALLGMPVTTAVPVSFAGSTSSMQAIDPFMQGTSSIRPNMGPLVAVAAHLIDGFDPRATQIVSDIVGPTTGAEASQERGALSFALGLIPNTPLRDAVEGGLSSLPGLLRSNDSIWMQTLANLDYMQNVAMSKWENSQQYKDYVAGGGDPNAPDAPGRPNIIPAPEAPPSVRQAFVDRVKNQARFVRLVQAVMAEVTPASPQPIVGNQKIPAEFQKLVQKEGINQAYVDFAALHPDAGPLIQAKSDVTGSGVLAASKNAQNWIDKNYQWVVDHKDVASFFVPQVSNDKYDPSAYNEQIAMGLRGYKTPQEFQNDFYVNTGWADYDVNRNVYNQQLAAGADPTSLRQAWNQWLTTFKAQNPTWAAAYDDPNTKINAQQALVQLRQVVASGTAPKTSQMDVVRNMLQQYDNYLSMLTPGANGVTSPTTSANMPVTEAWSKWLKDTAASSPEYAPLINKIFRWL